MSNGFCKHTQKEKQARQKQKAKMLQAKLEQKDIKTELIYHPETGEWHPVMSGSELPQFLKNF